MLAAGMSGSMYASIVDVRERRVPNWIVAAILVAGGLGYSGLWVLGHSYMVRFGAALVLGFFVAYSLFAVGFLGAGDAKLLWALGLALPPSMASGVVTSFDFPVWAVLLNSMVLSGSYSLLVTSLKGQYQRPKVAWKQVGLGGLELVGCCGVVLTTAVVFPELRGRWAEMSVVGIVICRLSRSYLTVVFRVLLTTVGLLLLALLALGEGGLFLAVVVVAVVLVMEGACSIVPGTLSGGPGTDVQLAAVEEGMIPCQSIYAIGRSQGTGVEYGRSANAADRGRVLCRAGRPLSSRACAALHAIAGETGYDRPPASLRVERDQAYAPFLALGMFLAVVGDGSILGVLSRL